MLSYLDVFRIFTIGMLVLAGAVLMLRRVKLSEKPVIEH
jgi:hypothetical protein